MNSTARKIFVATIVGLFFAGSAAVGGAKHYPDILTVAQVGLLLFGFAFGGHSRLCSGVQKGIEMPRVKQVICVCGDLDMKPGKLASQVAHASMAFLSNKIRQAMIEGSNSVQLEFSEAETIWLRDKFTKIILQAENEDQMREISQQAKEVGLYVVEIVDDGTTAFNGQPTLTCLGIGPDNAEKIDAVTGKLKLLR